MSLRNKALAFNLSYMYNDKHDYTLLYQQISEARSHATSIGPVLMEIMTFRCLEHCGPNVDDDLNYRSTEYIDFWSSLDFLRLLEDDIASCYPSMDLSLVTNEISTEIDSLCLASILRKRLEYQINFPQAINRAIKIFSANQNSVFHGLEVLTIRSVSLGLLPIFLNCWPSRIISRLLQKTP